MSSTSIDGDNLVFDVVELDLFVKVLSKTVFSPFFTFFLPIMFRAHGANWSDRVVLQAIAWFTFTVVFWFMQASSRAWTNNVNPLKPPRRFDWGEQIVLVTGGASGIGALLANTLAVRNVTVVVLDTQPLVTENYNISFFTCDVSNWEEVRKTYADIVESVGYPTIIINNAGVAQGKLIMDLSPQDLQQTFGVNVIGQFNILKACLPSMIKDNSGHVITVSSVLGEVGASQLTDYCASKAALVSLNETLRYELDRRYNAPNVRTTIVLAGHIATPLFSSIMMPKSWLVKFCIPTLPPHTVVKSIITALDEQCSSTIRLPFYVNLVPWVKMAPSYVIDLTRWITGSDFAMQKFVKVSGRRSDEKEPSSHDAPQTDQLY